jgi:hypothetical protein
MKIIDVNNPKELQSCIDDFKKMLQSWSGSYLFEVIDESLYEYTQKCLACPEDFTHDRISDQLLILRLIRDLFIIKDNHEDKSK